MICDKCDHGELCKLKVEGLLSCSEYSGWITDRNPERNGKYLIKTKSGHKLVARYFVYYGWHGKVHDSVTAWRYLPK